MRKIAMAATLSAAVATLGLAAMPASAAPGVDAKAGCPSGAVCIKETNGSILSKNIFYTYGAHNLSNVTGDRVIVNNQTGGAGLQFCYGYNGTNCPGSVQRWVGESKPYNVTPMNSVVLVK